MDISIARFRPNLSAINPDNTDPNGWKINEILAKRKKKINMWWTLSKMPWSFGDLCKIIIQNVTQPRYFVRCHVQHFVWIYFLGNSNYSRNDQSWNWEYQCSVTSLEMLCKCCYKLKLQSFPQNLWSKSSRRSTYLGKYSSEWANFVRRIASIGFMTEDNVNRNFNFHFFNSNILFYWSQNTL